MPQSVDDYSVIIGYGRWMFTSGEFDDDRLFEYLDAPHKWRTERRDWLASNSIEAGCGS